MKKASHLVLSYHAKKGMLFFFAIAFLATVISSFIKTPAFGLHRFQADYFKLKEQDSLQRASNSNKLVFTKKQKKKRPLYKKRDIKLFRFDPNQLDASGFQKLGFSKKQSKVILKFRNIINGFRHKNDFKKCFVVSDKKWKQLKPYIFIETTPEKRFSARSSPDSKYKKVEINSATALDFEKLYGIGKVLSKRIVKYRENLGGFYSINQLLEVYGVKDSLLINNRNRIILDSNLIRPIIIQSQTLQTSIKHPYLSAHKSKKLIEFIQSNPTLGMKEWLNYGLINRKEYDKLKHYIKLEQSSNGL